MRRLWLVAVLACAAVVVMPIQASSTSSSVKTLANISNDGPDSNGDNEVDIAINPTNPDNLIAAWNDYGPGQSCGLGYSFDGGKTWTTSWLRGVTPLGGNATFDYGAGDPSVGFLKDGTAVLSCAAWGASKSQPSALFASRSTDGGRNWAPVQQLTFGQNLGHLQDHNMLTIDPYGDRVLVAYSVWNGYRALSYALISSDGGNTYAGPYEIASDYTKNAVDRFDVSLAGAPDGTVYATTGIWQHVQEWSEQAVVVSQMRPGETKFTRSVKVRDLVPAPMTLPGESWRTSMQASIGVEGDGTVDLLTGDFATGNLDIYLARSHDHGASFPASQQANLTNDANDQVMPWMSVRAERAARSCLLRLQPCDGLDGRRLRPGRGRLDGPRPDGRPVGDRRRRAAAARGRALAVHGRLPRDRRDGQARGDRLDGQWASFPGCVQRDAEAVSTQAEGRRGAPQPFASRPGARA